MKWLIASDIHGSAKWCREVLAAWERDGASRLLLLGDLLYHGPRNDLPEEYAPKEVARMLNERREGILCVRGNCEAEVDQMMLEFPVMADYALLADGERLIFSTHGHIFNQDRLPPLRKGDTLLLGHTHVPVCLEREGIRIVNPGSAAIPKAGSRHSCMTLEDGRFRWHDLCSGAEYQL